MFFRTIPTMFLGMKQKYKYSENFPQTIVFPRIAIKTEINPDALVVRETEKVLDEKITTRTEEILDDVTGLPHLRTVQVVEKLIETEVVLFILFIGI